MPKTSLGKKIARIADRVQTLSIEAGNKYAEAESIERRRAYRKMEGLLDIAMLKLIDAEFESPYWLQVPKPRKKKNKT